LKYEAGRFPVAEQAAQQILSLPIYPDMTDEQVDRVIDRVRAFF
jgi:dTDP-4-amino-4,6-dideoxygalactose transaminase